MGVPGKFRHPDYLAAVARIVTAAEANGEWAAYLAADEASAREYWGHGFRVIAYGVDIAIYQVGCGRESRR